MSNRVAKSFAAVAFCALIAACGGGGDSNAGATSTQAFPLLVGFRALVVAGTADNFTISGSCSGSAREVDAPATPSSFEGVPGYSATSTMTLTFTNCSPPSIASSGTSYYDANYSPLGSDSPGVTYSKFSALPPLLPASVKVGDGAAYTSMITYADSSKAVTTGRDDLSYVVEPDTSVTAIVNLVTKSYNATGQLETTQQSRYRIAADGTLTPTTIDIQISLPGNTNHYLLTKT